MQTSRFFCDACGRELPRGKRNLVDLSIHVVRDVRVLGCEKPPVEHYVDFCEDCTEVLYNVIKETMKGLIEQRQVQEKDGGSIK